MWFLFSFNNNPTCFRREQSPPLFEFRNGYQVPSNSTTEASTIISLCFCAAGVILLRRWRLTFIERRRCSVKNANTTTRCLTVVTPQRSCQKRFPKNQHGIADDVVLTSPNRLSFVYRFRCITGNKGIGSVHDALRKMWATVPSPTHFGPIASSD